MLVSASGFVRGKEGVLPRQGEDSVVEGGPAGVCER